MRGIAPSQALHLGGRVASVADGIESLGARVVAELAGVGRSTHVASRLTTVDASFRSWSRDLIIAADRVTAGTGASAGHPWPDMASDGGGTLDPLLAAALENLRAIALHQPAVDILESPIFGGALELLRDVDLHAYVADRGDVGVVAWAVAFDAALVLDAMGYPTPAIPTPEHVPDFPQRLFDELVLAVIATRIQQMGAAAVDVHTELNLTSVFSGLAALRAIRHLGRTGRSSRIRIVDGGLEDAQQMFAALTTDGVVVVDTTYSGVLVRLPDDTLVGLRTTMTKSPSAVATIDIHRPGQRPWKAKFVP